MSVCLSSIECVTREVFGWLKLTARKEHTGTKFSAMIHVRLWRVNRQKVSIPDSGEVDFWKRDRWRVEMFCDAMFDALGFTLVLSSNNRCRLCVEEAQLVVGSQVLYEGLL